MASEEVNARCPRCKADYRLTVNLTGMDKVGIKTFQQWIQANGVKEYQAKKGEVLEAKPLPVKVYLVTCWQCCHENSIGAEPTHGKHWEK